MTISLCMIVKNESAVLARCLDSLEGLMDEIIIVDTGSTDDTKEVAYRYTDRVYDFQWVDDFSAARNFSFSLATMDYIYAPDADEVLDAVNHERFLRLKESLLPEVEIVQMHYLQAGAEETVLNAQRELRPKLFKRLRTFEWTDPVHETVRLEPLVYDSDIEIMHMPQGNHGSRDFGIFERTLQSTGALSPKLTNMYARELLKVGKEEDLIKALDYFSYLHENAEAQMHHQAACVLARLHRLQKSADDFFRVALFEVTDGAPCSEICCEIGLYFEEQGSVTEAIQWLEIAAYQSEAILDIHTSGDIPLRGLIRCLEQQKKVAAENFDSLLEMNCDEMLKRAKGRLEAFLLENGETGA